MLRILFSWLCVKYISFGFSVGFELNNKYDKKKYDLQLWNALTLQLCGRQDLVYSATLFFQE